MITIFTVYCFEIIDQYNHSTISIIVFKELFSLFLAPTCFVLQEPIELEATFLRVSVAKPREPMAQMANGKCLYHSSRSDLVLYCSLFSLWGTFSCACKMSEGLAVPMCMSNYAYAKKRSITQMCTLYACW